MRSGNHSTSRMAERFRPVPLRWLPQTKSTMMSFLLEIPFPLNIDAFFYHDTTFFDIFWMHTSAVPLLFTFVYQLMNSPSRISWKDVPHFPTDKWRTDAFFDFYSSRIAVVQQMETQIELEHF